MFSSTAEFRLTATKPASTAVADSFITDAPADGAPKTESSTTALSCISLLNIVPGRDAKGAAANGEIPNTLRFG